MERLNEAVKSVLESSDVAQNAAQQAAIPAYLPPAQLATTLAEESVARGRLIKQQKIAAE